MNDSRLALRTRIERAIVRLAVDRDHAVSEANYCRGLLARCKYNITDPELKAEIEAHLREPWT